uniref:Uncharacterized protein n=1 Tax=Oryza barthii TaxID=65489 RepID=A0A0D3GDA3_9ORYZ
MRELSVTLSIRQVQLRSLEEEEEAAAGGRSGAHVAEQEGEVFSSVIVGGAHSLEEEVAPVVSESERGMEEEAAVDPVVSEAERGMEEEEVAPVVSESERGMEEEAAVDPVVSEAERGMEEEEVAPVVGEARRSVAWRSFSLIITDTFCHDQQNPKHFLIIYTTHCDRGRSISAEEAIQTVAQLLLAESPSSPPLAAAAAAAAPPNTRARRT